MSGLRGKTAVPAVRNKKESLWHFVTVSYTHLDVYKRQVVNSVYARLEAAGQRLLAIIRNGKGMANKDMGKFADQINALCDKWQ